MKTLGFATLLSLAFAAPLALADGDRHRSDQYQLIGQTGYHGYWVGYDNNRHYRTGKRRHYKKYRKCRRNDCPEHRGHYYDYYLNFQIYPYSYNRNRSHRRHYREGYRGNYRHRGCRWHFGVGVPNGVIHDTFDNPLDEWHYSGHRDYRDRRWQESDYVIYPAKDPEIDREQHYRRYPTIEYGG